MIAEGLISIFTSPSAILWNLFGTFVGIIFGAIPGLSAVMAMVLFLPLSFGLETIQGIALLLGLYVGGISGGMISAILLKIPGTPASVCTVYDGGPMAERGEAGKALKIGVLFSFIGGIISTIFLVFLSRPLASIALKFSPVEYCSIAVMSLTIIASLSGSSLVNGLISGCLGIFLSLIGTSPIGARPRLIFFGKRQLYSGIPTITLLIGIFAVAEIIKSVGDQNANAQVKQYSMGKGLGITSKEFREQAWNMLRSALLGVGIGILPGLGANTSSVLAYGIAQSSSKYPEKYGTGIIDGLVASETANNANTGGAMIPMLALGIPGNTPTALLIAALTVQGVNCGPLIFQKNGPLCYAIFAAFALANIFMLLLEWWGNRLFVKVLQVPKHILYPIIIVMCMVGTFADKNRSFEISVVVIIGILYYFFRKFGAQSAPCVIGYILGPMLEANFGQAISQSGGSFLPFVTRPISLFFLIITVIMVAFVIRKNIRHEKNILADDDD